MIHFPRVCSDTGIRRVALALGWVVILAGVLHVHPAIAQLELPADRSEDYGSLEPSRGEGWQPQLGGGFSLGLPLGEFADQIDRLAYGGSIFAGAGLPNRPVVLGLELGVFNYGSDSTPELLTGGPAPEVDDVRTTNNIFVGHLVLRVQARSGQIRPYLDGLVGVKYFTTDTTFTSDPALFNDPGGKSVIDSNNHLEDTVLSYGVGAGVDVRLIEWGGGQGDVGGGALGLSVGARYLRGSEARYLKSGSVRVVNNEISLDILRTRTDLLIFQVGIGVSFRF